MNSADFADFNAKHCQNSVQCRESCNLQVFSLETTVEWFRNSLVLGLSHRKELSVVCDENRGAFHSQKISYSFGKNPFVFKKNPSKIRVNPFVLENLVCFFQWVKCLLQKSVSNGKMIVFCFVVDLHARHLVNATIPKLTYFATRKSLKKSAKYKIRGIHLGIRRKWIPRTSRTSTQNNVWRVSYVEKAVIYKFLMRRKQ